MFLGHLLTVLMEKRWHHLSKLQSRFSCSTNPRTALVLAMLAVGTSVYAKADCSMKGTWIGNWEDPKGKAGAITATFTQTGTSVTGTVDGVAVTGTGANGFAGFGPVTVNNTKVGAGGTFSQDCHTLTGGFSSTHFHPTSDDITYDAGTFWVTTSGAVVCSFMGMQANLVATVGVPLDFNIVCSAAGKPFTVTSLGYGSSGSSSFTLETNSCTAGATVTSCNAGFQFLSGSAGSSEFGLQGDSRLYVVVSVDGPAGPQTIRMPITIYTNGVDHVSSPGKPYFHSTPNHGAADVRG